VSDRRDAPDDPLRLLRDAWEDFERPAPNRTLSEEDARTREVVAWMREAWDTVGFPDRVGPVVVPTPPGNVPTQRDARPLPAWLSRWGGAVAVAAAAILLVAGGLWHARRVARLSAPDASISVARTAPHEPGLDPDSREGSQGSDVRREAASPTHAISEPRFGDRLVASSGPDRLELRSGPVRFVLVTTPWTGPRSGSTESEKER